MKPVMETTFEPARPADVDTLMTLHREFCGAAGQPFDGGAARGAVERLLGDESLGHVWLIRHGGASAGYVVLTFGFSLEFRGRDAFVDELYVREAYRGRGVGTAALRFVEGACRGRGITALHLEVDRDNTPAQSVYRKVGFGDRNNYLLTKWLTPPGGRERP